MAYTATGTVSINNTFTAAIPSSGNVITGYSVPASAAVNLSYVYSASTGAPLTVNKIGTAGGSLAPSQGAASILNLTTGLGVDGVALALTHVRELSIYNDGRTAFATTDTDVLTFDTTFANSFGVGSAGVGPLETASKIDIPAGGHIRFAKPYGAAGWVVDGTHTVIALLTPANANTINYRIVVVGDSF